MTSLDIPVASEVVSRGEICSLYDDLLSLMEKEAETYEELLSLSEREAELLVGSSFDELCENNAKKETCTLKAKMLDEARSALVKTIAGRAGLTVSDVTLSALLPHGRDAQAAALSACRDRLHILLVRIRELNEKNRMLLDSSLNYIQKSIRFIGHLMSPGALYSNEGKLQERHLAGKLLVRKG